MPKKVSKTKAEEKPKRKRRRGPGAGRPGTITDEIVSQLEYWVQVTRKFSEARWYLGISKAAWERKMVKDKAFRTRMHRAKRWQVLKAREVMAKALQQGNIVIADKTLRLRMPDEYIERPQQHEVKGDISLNITRRIIEGGLETGTGDDVL